MNQIPTATLLVSYSHQDKWEQQNVGKGEGEESSALKMVTDIHLYP